MPNLGLSFPIHEIILGEEGMVYTKCFLGYEAIAALYRQPSVRFSDGLNLQKICLFSECPCSFFFCLD